MGSKGCQPHGMGCISGVLGATSLGLRLRVNASCHTGQVDVHLHWDHCEV